MPLRVSYKDYLAIITRDFAILYKNDTLIIKIEQNTDWKQYGVSAAQVASCSKGDFIKLSLQEQIIFELLASVSQNYVKHKIGMQKGTLLSNYKKAMELPPGMSNKQRKLLRGANEKIFFREKDSPRQILKFAKIGAAAIINPGTHQEKEAIKVFKKIKSLKIL